MKYKFEIGDRVKVLDGSKIENYTSGWAMKEKEIETWNRRTNDAEVHSADVQEVKHARWIPDDKAYIWRCSECGHFTNERIVKWYRDIEGNVCYRSDQPPFYCSRCGAKMNLEEKGK